MKLRKEYETGGYVFGQYFCNSSIGTKNACPTTIQVKAPTLWMMETDLMTFGLFAFTWIFFLWLAWFGWQMIQSILDLNDEIFGHLGLKKEDSKVVEGQMSLADFVEEE